MENKKISVIIPVYNGEKHLVKCLESIKAQTFHDFECVLVNDCSKDNSVKICNKYSENDNRIKLINNKKNIGSSLSRKKGLDNSCGEYIIFVDADDYLEADMLERLFSKAVSLDLDMVYCDYYHHNKTGETIYVKTSLYNDFVMDVKHSIFGFGINGHLWNKLIKRKIYEKIDFPKDGYAEDKYISTQTFFFTKKTGYVNSALYNYQYNNESWVYNKKKKMGRYTGLKNNYKKIHGFIKSKDIKDMAVFEPEFNKRIKFIKSRNPLSIKKIAKYILRFLIPFKSWRKYLRKISTLLFLFVLFSACTVGRQVIIKPPETEPEEKLSAMEQMIKEIRQNGDGIEKYYLLGENGAIIVKADITNTAGNFEVIYDLVNAQPFFHVPFSINCKDQGLIIQDTLIWTVQEGGEGILLGFDDNYFNSWEQSLDIFDEYKARCTFFVQGTVNSFCKNAINRGHSIGFHTLNHPDLRKISRNEFNRETVLPLESFRKEGVQVSAFAFPFGFSEPWMDNVLLPHYRVLRGYGITFNLYDKDKISNSRISSRSIDREVFPDDGEFYKSISEMLRALKFIAKGQVLPLTTHSISDSAQWGISISRLEFLLKTAKELNLLFYTYGDF